MALGGGGGGGGAGRIDGNVDVGVRPPRASAGAVRAAGGYGQGKERDD